MVKPHDQNALYGRSVMFNCISEGQPTPQISWKVKLKKHSLEPEPLISVLDDSVSSKYSVLNNGSLLVKSAMVEDEGDYFCFSDSPGLIVNTSASLTVYGKSTRNTILYISHTTDKI